MMDLVVQFMVEKQKGQEEGMVAYSEQDIWSFLVRANEALAKGSGCSTCDIA